MTQILYQYYYDNSGLPIKWEHSERIIWDAMRISRVESKKEKLLFAFPSKWKTSS